MKTDSLGNLLSFIVQHVVVDTLSAQLSQLDIVTTTVNCMLTAMSHQLYVLS